MKGSYHKPTLNKKSKYKNGEIPAAKLTKFVATEKSKSFVYRSSYEYSFMLWCENNGNVKAWSSEPHSIKYFCPVKKKERSYWIDFTVEMTDSTKLFVEIKPEKDKLAVQVFQKMLSTLSTSEAKTNYIQSNKVAANNFAKWQTAIKYCKERNYIFQLVTEKFLKFK